MGTSLLLVLATPSVVVAGVPDCWVDTRRLNQWLRRSPANDNGRDARAVHARAGTGADAAGGATSSSSGSCPS